MNFNTEHSEYSHHEIQLLLPWYLNQTLEAQEQQLMDQHVKQCLLCRRELVSLQKLSNAVTKINDLDIAAQQSFDAIASKLPSRTRHSDRSINVNRPNLIDQLLNYLCYGNHRYVLAASIMLLIIPFGLRVLPQLSEGSFYTLSAARPVSNQAMELRVVFAKSTTVEDVDAILKSLHGQLSGEPNSIGAVTVRLNADDKSTLDQALALLRSRQDVLLAEPVLQP